MNLNPLHIGKNLLNLDGKILGKAAEGGGDALKFGWNHGGSALGQKGLGLGLEGLKGALGHLSLSQLWAVFVAVMLLFWQALLGFFPQLDRAVSGMIHPSSFSTASAACTTLPVGGAAGVGYRFGGLLNKLDQPLPSPADMQKEGEKFGKALADGWHAMQLALGGATAPTDPTSVVPPDQQVGLTTCCPGTTGTTPADLTGSPQIVAAKVSLAAGFTGNNAIIAVAVAGAESGWVPTAIGAVNSNGTRDYGLFQINSIHNPTAQNWADPATNARMAMTVFRSSGWRAWSTFNSGAYSRWLPQAQVAVAQAQGQAGPFIPMAEPAGNPAAAAPTCTPGSGTTPAGLAPGSTAAKVIAFARAQIGEPYVWGAVGPDSWDCSGLVIGAYAAAGMPFSGRPTTATLISMGTPVAQADLQPGDLVFPDSGHVVIFAGNGQIIEAPHPGATVREGPFYGMWQARRIIGASTQRV